MKPDLRAALAERALVGDGAMGTYLYQLGFPIGVSFEEYNLLQPDVIADVHRRYIAAGAEVIETNTFSAQHGKLAKYGLEKKAEQINAAGVALARKAAGDRAYVVGAIGAIRAGRRKNVRTANIRRDFEEQAGALIGAGPDGLLLETFFDLEELSLALGIIRKLSDIPVICQFAVEDPTRTHDGVPLPEAFARLAAEGADVIGFNCRSGPNGILRALEAIPRDFGLPLSAFPNAGLPDYVDGQVVYSATPEYMGANARRFADLGARLIGGCCGTTPAHIAAIAGALRGYAPDAQAGAEASQSSPAARAQPAEPAPIPAKAAVSPSIVELVRQRHTVIVELDPPRELDIAKFMAGAAALKDAQADALTMADNSLAVTRMSNMALAALVQERVGIRPLVHLACRDRNLIGTQSHLMGFDALGIDHVLAVTGDPAKFGDLPGSSSVYDLTSFEIIRMIKQLNEGIAFSGKPLKQKAGFVVGAAFNPNVKYLDKAVQRLERKIASGADYVMTQPVYDAALIERIAEATRHLAVPVFLGIFPLASGRNAEYLHNEVPGIQLSDEVRRRMSGLEGPAGRAEGVAIAKELLDSAMAHFNGIYLMTPFLFYDMTAELTRYVKAQSKITREDGQTSCPPGGFQVE
ncbi:bifunctional homocysteine S-methyltransferase/methylenetetrahydrofolate reductase [Cohnella nanjingensis]|uniref:Bifunctional homocysteine S-methyltransferase/methylenetetrahydrofolate reductase n=1 Tax=Cohnella nanjingensis TaxID=1387779 RepID=A0A7X0RPA0_9BACL|nr:bifunctional homocysteine S-methyltransferase/methylenetetrahydrofolate reductase [Cohnella nanjingensis]MBB6671159.1 bifunctional homocysteine S-methyltransferase/methylenetetrahydrofolate reductase [Cohnella nanjingensis]